MESKKGCAKSIVVVIRLSNGRLGYLTFRFASVGFGKLVGLLLENVVK